MIGQERLSMQSKTTFKMKTTLQLIVLALGLFALSGCDTHGKKYNHNSKQNVYYKGDGLDEAAAKKLADYLAEIKYFDGDKELSVQITKEKETKDTVNINFVVDEAKVTPEIETTFLLLGGFISNKVYKDGPVNINFIDSHFGLIKKLGYAKPYVEEPAADTNTQ